MGAGAGGWLLGPPLLPSSLGVGLLLLLLLLLLVVVRMSAAARAAAVAAALAAAWNSASNTLFSILNTSSTCTPANRHPLLELLPRWKHHMSKVAMRHKTDGQRMEWRHIF